MLKSKITEVLKAAFKKQLHFFLDKCNNVSVKWKLRAILLKIRIWFSVHIQELFFFPLLSETGHKLFCDYFKIHQKYIYVV